MKDKNNLDEILHELFIVLHIHSGSVIEARDLLLNKYKSIYDSQELYKVIHQRLRRLEALNLIEMTTLNDPGPVSFKITAQFHYQHFAQIKPKKTSKKNDRKTHQVGKSEKNQSNGSSNNSLIAIVKERIKEADNNASKLRVLEEKLTENASDLESTFNTVINLWLNSRCCKS